MPGFAIFITHTFIVFVWFYLYMGSDTKRINNKLIIENFMDMFTVKRNIDRYE